jgi:hypothetical protein
MLSVVGAIASVLPIVDEFIVGVRKRRRHTPMVASVGD